MALDPTRSPFPGMDPYLEQSWPDVHHRLCTYACDAIRPKLPAGLIPRLDERTIIEDPHDRDRVIVPDVRVVQRGRPTQPSPDSGGTAVLEPGTNVEDDASPFIVSVEFEPTVEGFIKVIDTRNENRVVTVIEFASPANKTFADGRGQYERKQKELIAAGVSLVEVDLVRAGRWNSYVPMRLVPERRRTPYHVCVTRGYDPAWAELYSIGARQKLPTIKVPLRQTDADVPLDLAALMALVYLNGSYGYDLDYVLDPDPPLPPADAAWARQVLTEHGVKAG
ncbi:MAG: hypothetical protein JWO31_227 [Phycisphaerales bacterium]|nr:hypothetical protein [Phycisphaerales bacterium]